MNIVWGRISGIGWLGNSTDASLGSGGNDLSRRTTVDMGRCEGVEAGVNGPLKLESVLEELLVVRPRESYSGSPLQSPEGTLSSASLEM